MKISRTIFKYYPSIGQVVLLRDEINDHESNILSLMFKPPIWKPQYDGLTDSLHIGIYDEKSYSTIETYVYLFGDSDENL